jgi:hypothetical protein
MSDGGSKGGAVELGVSTLPVAEYREGTADPRRRGRMAVTGKPGQTVGSPTEGRRECTTTSVPQVFDHKMLCRTRGEDSS